MTKIQPTLQSNSCRPCLKYYLKTVTLVLSLLVLGVQAAQAQAPPCPASGSTTNFTFAPQFLGDNMTVTIDLAPCETIELHASHNMNGDPNRGTQVKVSFLNSSDITLYWRSFSGFYTASDNLVPSSHSEPFPWAGVRSALVLPAKIKVESVIGYGQGNPPSAPQYNFTIIRAPRPGYNIGGDSFSNAPLAPSLPTTYRGSVRDGHTGHAPPHDPGQYFKVHLNGNQAIKAFATVTQNTPYGTIPLLIFNINSVR